MSDIDATCQGCKFLQLRDSPDRTTRQVCGITGGSTVFHRAPFDTLHGVIPEPAKWCGPEATLRVERKP